MHSQRLLVFPEKYKYSVRREQWRPKWSEGWHFIFPTKILVDATDWTVNATDDSDAVKSRGKIFSHKKPEGLPVCSYRHFLTGGKNGEDITGKTAVTRKWFLSHIYALKQTSLYTIVSFWHPLDPVSKFA